MTNFKTVSQICIGLFMVIARSRSEKMSGKRKHQETKVVQNVIITMDISLTFKFEQLILYNITKSKAVHGQGSVLEACRGLPSLATVVYLKCG